MYGLEGLVTQYMGRLRPKQVPFSGWRYTVHKGVGSRSIKKGYLGKLKDALPLIASTCERIRTKHVFT